MKATLNEESHTWAPYSSSAWPKKEVLFNLRASGPSAQSNVPLVKTINNPIKNKRSFGLTIIIIAPNRPKNI